MVQGVSADVGQVGCSKFVGFSLSLSLGKLFFDEMNSKISMQSLAVSHRSDPYNGEHLGNFNHPERCTRQSLPWTPESAYVVPAIAKDAPPTSAEIR